MRSSMSKMALSRCRILIIGTESEEPYSRILSVVDPRRNYQVVTTYRTRTDMDTRRVKQRFMGSYRIPAELVFVQPALELPTPEEIQAKIDSLFHTQIDTPPEEGEETNADRTDKGSPEIHESR